MSDPLLVLKNLKVSYGPVEALHGISLEVRPGELVALIGANGAGKTTALGAVSGLLPTAGGEVRFEGADLAGIPAHARARRGLVLVPEGRRIFPKLTVLENLRMGAYGRDDDLTADLEKALTLFPILKDRAGQPGGTLSGGEQQMLAIARALLARPRCLLLDEPSLGLAPKVVGLILDILKKLRAEGMTMLLVEQNARAALELADRAYVLETGRIVLEGPGRTLLDNPSVRRAYLGA